MSEQANNSKLTISARPELLLVDDDPLIIDSLSLVLQKDYLVYTAESKDQVKALLQKLGHTPLLVLVDLGLPPLPHDPKEGFELINELAAISPNIKILVLSGQDDKTNIQHALTLGAVDFIPKPCDIKLLRARLAHQCMMIEAEQLTADDIPRGDGMLGESKAIADLNGLIKQFAETPFPVLIEGESGSGKELVAKRLHEQSPQKKAAFLTINCAAFSPELLEAQLFGHVKGAYTGASTSKAGFFEEAEDGCLFLDEVGDLPLDLQSKLLRVLENGEYYRLGETRPRISNARIIAATNRELRQEVRIGAFRQDLYHRLSVLTVHVPPLRERENDCLLLLEYFRNMYALDKVPFTLDKEAENCLLDYSFPGNVRELRNIVIRLCAKYPGKTVDVEALREELESMILTLTTKEQQDHTEAVEQELLESAFRLDDNLKAWESRYITTALAMSGGNLSKAARLLGINRTTLYSRIQRLSIEAPE